MARVVLFVAVLLTFGCVHTYEMESGGKDAPSMKLSPTASFFVGLPQDGQFENQHYFGSGKMTAHAIVNALSVHVGAVESASEVASVQANLEAARSAAATYLIQPTILHWEDRATEWSGRSDRMSVRLQLIAVSNGRVLNSTVISGKSRWATFGGDHPQDLLYKPLGRYVSALF